MANPSTSFARLEVNTRMPPGYQAVPFVVSSPAGTARLCLLAAREAGDAGPLVVLRSSTEALYYLGCLVDYAGRWLEWVEVAVQQVEGLQNTPAAFREMLTNHILDIRWQQRTALLRELQPDEEILCGWENHHPPPLFLDVKQGKLVTTGEDLARPEWELCLDDGMLEDAQLPPYRNSQARYLYHVEAGADSGFVPLTRNAPLNEATVELADVLPKTSGLRAVNAACGLMEVRRFHPVSCGDYLDLLAGRPWRGLRHGSRILNVDEGWPGLSDLTQAAGMENQTFLGRAGPAARLAETYYLKLHFFTQAARLVRQIVRRTQLPFLNLTDESFRVRFESRSGALPLLWTARLSLAVPGQAMALRVKNLGQRFFLRLGGAAHSIYLPGKVNQTAAGNAEVRLKGVQTENGETVLRGTLSLRQPLLVSSNDILWLRLPVAGSGTLSFFGNLQPEEALSRLDLPFRTWPQELDEEDVAGLQAASASFSLPPSPFEIIPMLSTPVDMYSLGVLGARAFLTSEEAGFQDTVDDLLSLAREMASRYQEGVPLADRVSEAVGARTNWLRRFGPHLMSSTALPSESALRVIGAAAWFELLSILISFFPGIGPDSVCPDYSHAQHGALESVFDEPLARLERLLVEARQALINERAIEGRLNPDDLESPPGSYTQD